MQMAAAAVVQVRVRLLLVVAAWVPMAATLLELLLQQLLRSVRCQ
jgi:hypothetical protein